MKAQRKILLVLLVKQKGGNGMASLLLNKKETAMLNAALLEMEKKNGTEYSFVPEVSAFSCKCSGPAQSCIWH